MLRVSLRTGRVFTLAEEDDVRDLFFPTGWDGQKITIPALPQHEQNTGSTVQSQNLYSTASHRFRPLKDVIGPMPYDPCKKFPFFAGDTIMDRRGQSSLILGYKADKIILQNEGFRSYKTVPLGRMFDKSLRLRKRQVTSWNTYVSWVVDHINFCGRPPTCELAFGRNYPVKKQTVIEFLEKEIDPRHPSTIYKHIFEWHKHGCEQINHHPSVTLPNALEDLYGIGIRKAMNSPGGVDIWHHYARDQGEKYARLWQTNLAPTVYSPDEIVDAFSEDSPDDKDSSGDDEPQIDGRPAEKDAYGLSEDMSDEEKLDAFLMDEF